MQKAVEFREAKPLGIIGFWSEIGQSLASYALGAGNLKAVAVDQYTETAACFGGCRWKQSRCSNYANQ